MDLVRRTVELPRGALKLWQPREAAELPDDGPVEWAPVTPYWSVLWRSGVALARELDEMELDGRRVIELGCGLGLPSIAAARAGADVLATDAEPEALELLRRNAGENGARIETAVLEWGHPGQLDEREPFDLAVGADVLYERQSVASLLALLPGLAAETWIVDPGRPAAAAFIDRTDTRWHRETARVGLVSVHRLRLRRPSDPS